MSRIALLLLLFGLSCAPAVAQDVRGEADPAGSAPASPPPPAAVQLAGPETPSSVQLAGPEASGSEADPAVIARDGAWKLCRVKVVLLLNTASTSKVVDRQEKLLFNGETFDLEREIPMDAGARHALVRFRGRIRAAVARTPGVVYHVTTEASLAAAVGFPTQEVGSEQVRHAYLDIDDTLTRLHEAFVSPALRARLLLAISVTPVFEVEDGGLALALSPPESVEIHHFRVEALSRGPDGDELLERTDVSTTPGHDAIYAFAQVAPAGGLGRRGVLAGPTGRRLTKAADSGFGREHSVVGKAPDSSWLTGHSTEAGGDYLAKHRVATTSSEALRTFSSPRSPKKLSEKKKTEIRERMQLEARRREAQELSKKLPGGPAPAADESREELSLRLRPLHVSDSFMQVEIRLQGSVRLPRETSPTPIDVRFIEELPLGEPFDLGLADLLRAGESEYDHVFRITPQP